MRLSLKKLAEIIGGNLQGANNMFSGISTDTRTLKKGEVFFALKGERFNGHSFLKEAEKKGAKGAVIRKGYKYLPKSNFGLVYVNDPLYALGEFARYIRAQRKIKVVAITGSVGKTTTKTMCELVLSSKYKVESSPGNYNNLIGLPLSIFQLKPETEVAVFELATNQPGEISRLAEICQPHIGIITKLAPAHLEGLKDLDGVEREKRALIPALGASGTFIFNLDDQRLYRLALGYAGKKIGITTSSKNFNFENMLRAKNLKVKKEDKGFYQHFVVERINGADKRSFPFKIKGTGAHLVENALFAIACGWALGIDTQRAYQALLSFSPLAGRGAVEKISEKLWLMDESYNASPKSMQKAILAFEQCVCLTGLRPVLVLGDMLELGEWEKDEHINLGRFLRQIKFEKLFYLGKNGQWLKEGLGKRLSKKLFWSESLDELKKELERELKRGGIFLIKASNRVGLWRLVDWVKEQKNAL